MANSEISVVRTEVVPDLSTNRSDIAASLLKSIPGAGGVLSEIITVLIPNQKMERVVEFLKIFADKVTYLEQTLLEEQMKTEEFADLLEDVIQDAARAVSPERREYLASLLKNSITRNELDHLGHKKILNELRALNDAEIVILKYHFIRDPEERDTYQKLHDDVVTYRPPGEDASEDERRQKMILHSYHRTLENRELTPGDLNKDNFAELLLRYIDLLD